MKRRNFIGALAALPFAAKPLAVLASQPSAEDLIVRQLEYQTGLAFAAMNDSISRNFYGVTDGDYLYRGNAVGVVTSVDQESKTITVGWGYR